MRDTPLVATTGRHGHTSCRYGNSQPKTVSTLGFRIQDSTKVAVGGSSKVGSFAAEPRMWARTLSATLPASP